MATSTDNMTTVTTNSTPVVDNDPDTTVAIAVSCAFTCVISLYIVMLQIGYKLLRTGSSMVRISFLSMLCITEVCYVAGTGFTVITAVCTAMAVLFHISCISTFTWLLSYILFLGNNLKRGYYSLSAGIYVTIGFAIPTCFVLISLIWRYQNYRQTQTCWISSEGHLDWALKGPIIGVIIISAILLVYVIKMYWCVDDPKQQVRFKSEKMDLLACAVILPMLGLTWLIGIFSVTEKITWMSVMFVACNMMLGVVVLLCMCVFNVEITQARDKHGNTYKALKERLMRSQEKDKVTRDREGTRTRSTAKIIMTSNSQILRDLKLAAEKERKAAAYSVPSAEDHESTGPTEEEVTTMFDNPVALEGTSREYDDKCLHVKGNDKPDLDSTDMDVNKEIKPPEYNTVIELQDVTEVK